MEKIKILVACHKQAEVFKNNVYLPIHVGKALHKDVDLGFLGDDTGENISRLNPLYCELTAQYWGWKNLDVEYIGLCHYRRYFKTSQTEGKYLYAFVSYKDKTKQYLLESIPFALH